MKYVTDIFENMKKKEFLDCYENYYIAKLARNIDLPAKNEEGIDMVHGARMAITRIEEYWKARIDLIKYHLDEEWRKEAIENIEILIKINY